MAMTLYKVFMILTRDFMHLMNGVTQLVNVTYLMNGVAHLKDDVLQIVNVFVLYHSTKISFFSFPLV